MSNCNSSRASFLRHCAAKAEVDSIYLVPENVAAYIAQRVLYMLEFELLQYRDREEGMKQLLKIIKSRDLDQGLTPWDNVGVQECDNPNYTQRTPTHLPNDFYEE